MKNPVHIFIDEFGNASLDTEKEGSYSHFIYTAVVIDESLIDNARQLHRQIVEKYFQGTHIKSSNISNNERGYKKRVGIIKELDKLQHYVFSLVINKEKLPFDPFEFKKVFYKFFNRIVAVRFTNIHSEIHLHIDKFGHKIFQDSVIEYMAKFGIDNNLFSHNSFDFKDDISEEPLIQLADFYSGCIGKYYCKSHYDKNAETLHELIKTRLFVEFYPREYTNYFGASTFTSDIFNKEIFDISTQSAIRFLDKINVNEMGYEIASCLLSEAFGNPFRIVSAKELIHKLKGIDITVNSIITEVSKLRDHGVLIVSPIGKKGYKLPCNEKEIAEFYDRFTSNVVPMLNRIGTLNQVLVEQSRGKYNVLSKDPYRKLSSLIDLIKNYYI